MSVELYSHRPVYKAFVKVLGKNSRFTLHNAYSLKELGILDEIDFVDLLFELKIPFMKYYSAAADKFTPEGRNLLADIAASLLEDNKVDAARSLLRLRNIEGIDTLLENMTPDDLNHIVKYKPHNL